MAEAKRPLPKLDEPDTGPFWAATAQQRLTYPRCRSCGQVVFYPRRHCNACLSTDLEWLQASGSGTVYTFSVVRQSYHPFFRALVPYAVGWIDLDEGPRLMSNVMGDPDTLRIGQRVTVRWEQHDGLSIPLFEPA